LRDLLHEEVTR
jgi:hypothetical protein